MNADIANVPTGPQTWSIWTFALQAQLRDINRVIYQQDGIALPEYNMDPLNLDQPGVQLEQFQAMMNNISALTGAPSYDFEDVNLRDQGQLTSWIFLVFTTLYQAANVLQV